MPYTILYVEDESAIIELVDLVLTHPKVKLITAFSGEVGLRLAREHNPDLVVLDVMIPDRSGWSIYNEIRDDDLLKDTPILMLTGQLHKYRIMKEFAQSKIDAYVTKPFDVGTVRDAVEKLLGVHLWSPTRPLATEEAGP